jgi:multimeric flavodoxin WrbA
VKTLIVNGARNPEGQTSRAAHALAQGATSAGAAVEHVLLPPMDLQRCRQCNNDGWGLCRAEGRCVIEDDFAALVERIAAADAVAFATPVYFSDLSESLRAFLDRLRRTCMHEAGKAKVAGKPAVGICVAGGGGGGAPHCTTSLTKVLATCGFDCVDMIPVRRQNLEAKIAALAATGRWLAGG